MKLEVPEEYQRKIDAFNSARGGPTHVAVAWNPMAKKTLVKTEHGVPVYDYTGRWQVFAIPVYDSAHPLARNEVTRKLMKRLPDDSSREGVLIFTWCQRNEAGDDVGYEPLDNRIFQLLDWADTFKDKQHFDKAIKEPELRRELADKARFRAIAGGAAEYWRGLDKLTISMNPATRVGGSWRDAGGMRR